MAEARQVYENFLLPTVLKFAEMNDRNKRLLAISLASHGINSVLAHLQGDGLILKAAYVITGIVAPVAAASMLA